MGQAVCEARVRSRTLVAAFTDSNPPVVWHFDLEKNHSFAVAIQGKDGDWHLGVVSPRGDFTSVARYEQRADVDQAWHIVRAAMLNPVASSGQTMWQQAGLALMLFLGLCLAAAAGLYVLLNSSFAP